MSKLAASLLGVYAGRRDVYGRQRVRVSLDEVTGRPAREATWVEVKEPLTTALVEQHLGGTVTLGVYLLCQDSSCAFAVWDIDSGEPATTQLMMRVLREHGIDYLLSASGRKGWHLTVAFAEPVPGATAYGFTRALWEEAGRPDRVECFPKQGVITPERPYGNLIKLPLGTHRATGRRATLLTDQFEPLIEGTEIDQLEGLARVNLALVQKLAATHSTSGARYDSADFRGPPHKADGARSVTSSGFVPAPYPCFAALSTARYREGERNTLLFTLSKHLANQGQPRAFTELVAERQAGRCVAADGRTPLPLAEWAQVVDSVYSRGYSSFGCEEPAMQRFCQGRICPLYQRQHTPTLSTVAGESKRESSGTTANPDPDAPEETRDYIVRLEDLTQVGVEEPEYEVEVLGHRVTSLTTDHLHSWPKFSKAVTGILRRVPELPRVRGMRPEDVWRALVNEALATSTLEMRPDNAGSGADIVEAALGWLKHGTASEERSDLWKGASWDRAEPDGTVYRYFVPRFVVQVIRGKVGPVTQIQLYGLLRRQGASGVNIKVDRHQVWCWRIPMSVLERVDI